MPDVQFFDPQQEAEVKRKRLMAEMMMRQGQQPDKTEVVSGYAVPQSPIAGLAKAIQQGVGGYQEGQANRMQAEDTAKRQKFLVDAMTGLKTDPQAAATALMSNPSTSDMGMRLYLGQLEADAKRGQLADQRAYEDMKWQREMDFKREQEAAKGGRGGYVPDPVTGGIVFDPTVMSDQPRKLSATEQKEMFEAQEKFDAGQGALGALKMAKNIYSRGEIDPATGQVIPGAKPYTGVGADIMPALARTPLIGDFIADKERGAATTSASNLVTQQALESLKSTFGGNPTEGERTILLQLQALPTYTPEEQKVILSNAMSAAERRAKAEQAKLSRIETGNYFGQSQMPPVVPLGAPQQSPMGAFPPEQSGLNNGETMDQIPPMDMGLGNVNDYVPPLGGNQQIGKVPNSNVPMVGMIQDGYRFKGGNPADPNSWEPTQ